MTHYNTNTKINLAFLLTLFSRPFCIFCLDAASMRIEELDLVGPKTSHN